MIPMSDRPIRIDSMKLAFEAFQTGRHPGSYTTGYLDLAERVLLHVRGSRNLVVEVPGSWLSEAPYCEEQCAAASCNSGQDSLDHLPEVGHQLLALMELAIGDLRRLWASGQKGPVRSLGYAMHCIPALVRRSDAFSRQLYAFCFQIVAFHWTAYSPELQQALCDLMGYSLDHAERCVHSSGFAINMFRSP
jgi:hypothetical protein